MKNKGFTLIELLAVIIILGILMTVAIGGVNSYIVSSRKNAYIASAKQYVTKTQLKVNALDYSFMDLDTTYYVHIDNLKMETGGQSPFGKWIDAYVAVIFDGESFSYYWVSVDETGSRVDLSINDDLSIDDIYTSNNLIINNREPIGNRNKIYIIDKNGNIIETTQIKELTVEEAKECYSFSLNTNDTATITYYDISCGKDIVIPGKIAGYTVTKINGYVFYNMQIKSVIFPDSIAEMGSRAFAYNSLKEVRLPSGIVTIGESAFLNNSISSVTFPEGLKTIDARAFRSNQISSFTLPNSLVTLGSCAFCDNPIPNPSFLYAKSNGVDDYSKIIGYIGDLSEFTGNKFIIPGEVNGVLLTTIGTRAFAQMSISQWEVVIPNSVVTIEAGAFEHSGIKKVTLPNGLKTIGNSAFYSNNIQELNIPASVTSIGVYAFNNNKVTTGEQYIYQRTTSGINYSVLIGYAGSNRENIVIPGSQNGMPLLTINSYAFNYLSLRGGLTIPSSVTKIHEMSFMLNNLTYVDNGDGNTTRGPFVFARKSDGSIDYESLIQYAGKGPSVVVPSTVKRLENYAFYYSSIKSIVLPEGLTYIGSNSFGNCYLTGTVIIPSTVTTIGNGAFNKVLSSTILNGELTKIVNKTGRAFNWTAITNSVNPKGNFVSGVLENWYGYIEITEE